jgi:hypothetical protein
MPSNTYPSASAERNNVRGIPASTGDHDDGLLSNAPESPSNGSELEPLSQSSPGGRPKRKKPDNSNSTTSSRAKKENPAVDLSPSQSEESSTNSEFEVEKIVGFQWTCEVCDRLYICTLTWRLKQIWQGLPQWLIQWKVDPTKPTWEPEENL